MNRNLLVGLSLLLTLPATASPEASKSPIAWHHGWDESLFDRAKQENRFVLLDLEAVWCHWCHVMEATTYQDPEVVRLIGSRYLAVRVDQDSRPDLSNRYEDYGWPATIIFDASGQELVKLSGYIPPPRMASLLQAIIDDPTPGPSVVAETEPVFTNQLSLPTELRAFLEQRHLDRYDHEHGSWGTVHKFLQADRLELSLLRAAGGDPVAQKMARQSLDAQWALLDPVWGGVYQYSHGGVWTNPHFEKIMAFQAANLRVYSMAYSIWKNPRDLEAVLLVARYLRDFLTSPEGAFYTSQDADLVQGQHAEGYFALDDAQRRAKGMPRIDQHIYSRENGWAIEGLVAAYAASGQQALLDQALRAADWILRHRSMPEGGFLHDQGDAELVHLGDTLAMGRAFLALYGATGDRIWLDRAEQAAVFLEQRFADGQDPGYVTSVPMTPGGKVRFPARPQREENIGLARFANLLFKSTGKARYRLVAENAMRYLVAPEIAKDGAEAGLLLADAELVRDPLHITIVGGKKDPKAAALFQAGLAYPSGYKRLEWFDRAEGALPNADVEYPQLPEAAAFVCVSQRCSLPIQDPAALAAKVESLTRKH